jgi:hypothetical protein
MSSVAKRVQLVVRRDQEPPTLYNIEMDLREDGAQRFVTIFTRVVHQSLS